MVTRLLKGGTLEDRIQKKETFSPETISQIIQQVAKALDYAHHEGVIHRDIKASNILFDAEGNAYLGDFGIAKLLNEVNPITATGQMLGTPHYMAPEQWSNEALSAATDIYALGVLAYLLVVGKLPFEASNPLQLLHKHLSEEVKFPEALSQPMIACLKQALAKKPSERYSKAGDFAAAFQAALFSNPPLSPQVLSISHEESSSANHNISTTQATSPIVRAQVAPTQKISSSSETWTRGAVLVLALLILFIVLNEFGMLSPVINATVSSSPSPSTTKTASISRTPRPSNSPSPTFSRTPRPTNSPNPSNTWTPRPTSTRTSRPSSSPSP